MLCCIFASPPFFFDTFHSRDGLHVRFGLNDADLKRFRIPPLSDMDLFRTRSSLSPYLIDNFSHLGGLLIGLLLGVVLYPAIVTTKRSRIILWTCRAIALPLVVLVFVLITLNVCLSSLLLLAVLRCGLYPNR